MLRTGTLIVTRACFICQILGAPLRTTRVFFLVHASITQVLL